MAMKWFAGIILILATASGSASGADMALKAMSPPFPATWTGFYVGANVGYGWGNSHTDVVGNGSISIFPGIVAGFPGFPSNFAFTDANDARLKGLIGGGQIGYNYQLNRRWVVGVEADLQIAGESGSNGFSDQFSTPVCGVAVGRPPVCVGTNPLVGTAATGYEAKIDGFGTVRARAGFLITDQLLLYGTGGLAYGRVEVNGNASIPAGAITGGPGTFVSTAGTFAVTRNNLGYSAGGGVEGRIFPWLPANWTWKAEYIYLDLGSLNSSGLFGGVFASGRGLSQISPMTGIVALRTRFIDNIVRVGLNYKFGK
jgi:outer membrane immunogenic protein